MKKWIMSNIYYTKNACVWTEKSDFFSHCRRMFAVEWRGGMWGSSGGGVEHGGGARDWNVTHGTACATVTSFGSLSAGGAEAVCECSPSASSATVEKDSDHVMEMSSPSVGCSLCVFWQFFESSRLHKVWMCSHVLTRLRLIGNVAVSQQCITLFQVRCAGWPWNELSEVSWSSQQTKGCTANVPGFTFVALRMFWLRLLLLYWGTHVLDQIHDSIRI